MTVIVLLAVIVTGMFLIHRLNSQHGSRNAGFHYSRGGVVAPDRNHTDGPIARRRAAVANDDERRGRRDGGRGRLRPRRRGHDVLAADRKERARIRSEKGIR
ncbi:hypothetical protein BZZ08_00563 [Streptomyces sp. MH60]|nr:hypothetical protein BZZ08_00563 [Streptomyces sp. MH60]